MLREEVKLTGRKSTELEQASMEADCHKGK